ncbi:MAG TPA: M81 family metallopeptidase [Planctomycetaceae bacterium]|nr:M81 family metallopeptidase [Planctomycetaceae bacterium]
MRIVSGGIQHETNTFASVPTTLADFERDSALGPDFAGGEAILRRYRGTGTIHGGYIDAAERLGVELAPVLLAQAQPAGIVTREAFASLLERLLERLDAARPFDAVVLDLHGAMVSEDHDDAEGAILDAVRDRVGGDMPVFVTLDLHANVTARMAALADCIIGFDTYPHVDMFERGREAVALLVRTLEGEVRPVTAFRQLPLITLPPMQCTLREPMQSLMAERHRLKSAPGVLAATVSMGFPFADIADAGVSVLVTADGDRTLAERTAGELAARLWDLRDALDPDLTSIQEVIRYAAEHRDGLVIAADGSDNPGGGAPCDGTVALRALIEARCEGAVVGVLYDPETVEQAHRAGVGATFEARIGGKTDDRHGPPIETPAYVRTLSDGRFTYHGPMRQGLAGDFGRMAVLVAGGVEVVLASRRMQLLDSEMLRIVGITPERRRLIVVKSAVHFRADIGTLATRIFDLDTPGVHRPDFANFTFRKLRRPIYPLDRDECWHPDATRLHFAQDGTTWRNGRATWNAAGVDGPVRRDDDLDGRLWR